MRIVELVMAMQPIVGWIYIAIVTLVIIALKCLVGITRQAWAFKETGLGLSLLAAAVVLHGVFISGASTFGPTPTIGADIIVFPCVYKSPCKTVTLSTDRGYVLNAPLPEAVDMDTFLGSSDRHRVTAQISLWDNQIHWMRTDSTTPATIVGRPATKSIFATVETVLGLSLLYPAWFVWRKAKVWGWSGETDPFAFIDR